MQSFDDSRKAKLDDPELRAEYSALEPWFRRVQKVIDEKQANTKERL